jgi:dCMP deaminase
MVRIRPSKWQTVMTIAKTVAQRSHDAETQVGVVLVNNQTGAIIATGCNGFVRNAPDDILPNTRPDKYNYIVHGEVNLVANCAYHGISMKDCTIVCTHSPCVTCMRLLYQAGITRVICETKYRDFENLQKMHDIAIKSTNIDELIMLEYEVKT